MNFAAAPAQPASATPDGAVAGMLAALRVMAERFTEKFGAPADLIKGGALYGKTRERILRWLHDMESVVRRMLLLRAALLPTPPQREPANAPKGAPRPPKEGDAETLFGCSEDPAEWRVSFRMPTPPEPIWMLGGFRAHEDVYDLGHRPERKKEDPAASFKGIGYYWVDDPRPLAERFEALRRIIDDPDHYAARLAQRLYGWRGREERRQLFLRGLCAITPIANEAGLEDSEWAFFAIARDMALALLPVFSAVATHAPALLNST